MKLNRFVLVIVLLVALVLSNPKRVVGGDNTYAAAGILAGEAPAGCEACIRVTACALVRDIQRGVNLRGRWWGFREPDPYSIYMIGWAMEDMNCDAVPKCDYVGSAPDVRVWAKKGWVSSARVWCNSNGCTACASR